MTGSVSFGRRKESGEAHLMPALDIASVGRRISGGLIDLVVTVIGAILVGWIFGLSESTSTGGTMSFSLEGWPFLFACLVVFLLFAAMEAFLGKTPGKFAVSTRVVDEDGDQITLVSALIRNALRFVDGIAFYIVGLVIVAIDGENRRLGDILAKTRVVND